MSARALRGAREAEEAVDGIELSGRGGGRREGCEEGGEVDEELRLVEVSGGVRREQGE